MERISKTEFLSNDPIDRYIRWRDRKNKVFKFSGKLIFWGLFITIIMGTIIGLIVGIMSARNVLPTNSTIFGVKNMNEVYSDAKLGGIVDWIITAMLQVICTVLWPLFWVFGCLAAGCEMIFQAMGGGTIINWFLNQSSFITQVSVIVGASVIFLVICVVWRAIVMSTHKDGDLGHAMAKSTPTIIFGSITAIVLIPIVFLFINGIVSQILVAIMNGSITDHQDLAARMWNACWSDSSHQKSNFWEIPTVGGSWMFDNNFQVGLCIIGWVGCLVICGLFTWYVVGILFNIIFLYILLFPAAGKWPHDEGGSAMAIKDEIVGSFINMFCLYFFFNLFSAILAGVGGLSNQLFSKDVSGFLPAVFTLVFILGGGFATWKMPNKIPALFSRKNSIEYTKAEELGKLAKNIDEKTGMKQNRIENQKYKDSHDGMTQKQYESTNTFKASAGRNEVAKNNQAALDNKFVGHLNNGKSAAQAAHYERMSLKPISKGGGKK